MKTKPFDLQAALNGAKLVTRDGRDAKFIAYVPEAKDHCRVIVMLPDGLMCSYYENGRNLSFCDTPHDLFLTAPTCGINDHEYPEPERVEPKSGTIYWVTDLILQEPVLYLKWRGSEHDNLMLRRGLVHLTREAAEAHARAIILAGGGEV
jgi:hypothetical protein